MMIIDQPFLKKKNTAISDILIMIKFYCYSKLEHYVVIFFQKILFEPVKVCLAECNSTEILPGSQLGKYAKAWLQKLRINI